MANLSGTELGPYTLHEVIGQGGMATVYRAYQPSMDRDVAIKIIASDLAADPEFMERFEREAQIIARLQHPHILPVYDFGHQDDLTYLVMRLVTSGSLERELQAGPVPVERVVELTEQIASALDYAHLRGIVHRDLKPTNILLDEMGNAYLTDFGIAKMIAGGASTGLTAQGTVMGTPTYMAPEQWRADPVDARTDVYALGVIVYQMLLGQVPFAADTPHGLMYQHLDSQPPPPHMLKPDLPLSIEPMISRALAKRPENRYASAGEMAQELERALGAPARLPEQTEFDVQAVHTEIAAGQGKAATLPAVSGEQEPVVPAPYVTPPPPLFQPQGQPPPAYVPPLSPAYEEPAGSAFGRGLVMLAAVIGGIMVIAAAAVIGLMLFSPGDGKDTPSPTPPPSPVTSTPDSRPRIMLQAPANNANFRLGDTVTIRFTASDRDGITRVELRRFGVALDSIAVGNQNTYQGVFEYLADSTGTHTLTVVPWRGSIEGDPASVTIRVD
ncbi:MAG: protein kinase [Anaerolineae bacterium]|nr:protein kinase [Anaerolineae bacterium]